MEQTTSALLQRLSESATIAMARKARELKDQGVDVISLSLGEHFSAPVEPFPHPLETPRNLDSCCSAFC